MKHGKTNTTVIILLTIAILFLSATLVFKNTIKAEGSIAVTTPVSTNGFVITTIDLIPLSGQGYLAVATLYDSINNQDYMILYSTKTGSASITPRITASKE